MRIHEDRPTEFRGILLDSPWDERGGGKIKRGADRHYPTMKPPEILGAIHGSGVWRPAADAHIYLWATNTFLPEGLWLMDALGFRYVTNFPWTKLGGAGLGQYARGAHELLLFGVRGRGYAAKTASKSIATDYLVGAPSPLSPTTGKRIHSAKPPRAFDLVQERTVGPWLELFSAGGVRRPGWVHWGPEDHRPMGTACAIGA